ncbi:MAG: hypothetical protein LBL07_06780 [Tannerella sp.]|nr:hypothetical protein [Tannerella sp.]
MKKSLFANGLSFLLILSIAGCSCYSKERYLKDFEKFITDVSQNHKSYDDKKWEKQTARYEKFTGEYYEKFEDDFTLKEKITVTGYKVKFNYFKKADQASSAIQALFDALKVDDIKKQLEYYIENDMQDEIRQFYDEAKKAGKEVESTVTDLLEDLNVNLNELKRKYEK